MLLRHASIGRIHAKAGTVCVLAHELDKSGFGHERQVDVLRK